VKIREIRGRIDFSEQLQSFWFQDPKGFQPVGSYSKFNSSP